MTVFFICESQIEGLGDSSGRHVGLLSFLFVFAALMPPE
jgi:hypothetical protein